MVELSWVVEELLELVNDRVEMTLGVFDVSELSTGDWEIVTVVLEAMTVTVRDVTSATELV